MTPPPAPVRKIVWKNLIFFIVTGSVGLIGGPWYAATYGISAFEWGLTAFFIFVTGMSITGGYHRLFAHRAYEAHPLVRFLALFFGAAAFEQPMLHWASQHRDHHKYVDTVNDPYNIKKGFWYAHIGWLVFWDHEIDHSNVADLAKSRMARSQHRHYLLWAAGAGIVFPVVLGALAGKALGAFILAVCFRLFFVHQSTFCINSVCHMFGRATYDIDSTAKDHWFVAFLTNGEGYHNYHHRFPSDYRNAVRWYQWDPTKWTIALLARLGLASDLKRISSFKILEAKLAADYERRIRRIESAAHLAQQKARIREALALRYEKLLRSLSEWETRFRDYKVKNLAFERVRAARLRYKVAYRQWEIFPELNALPAAA